MTAAIADGKYLCVRMASLDAPRGESDSDRTLLDVMEFAMDPSFASGIARSLRGSGGYYDAELDAVVRRPAAERKVMWTRGGGAALSDVGYAADVRRMEEAALERRSPIKSRKFLDWIVRGTSCRRRRRRRWRMVGGNPTLERYFRKADVVPACPGRTHSIGSGTSPFDLSVNRKTARELGERCGGCLYRCACSTWTVSGARFFTRGLHGALNCRLGGANGTEA